MIDPSVIRPAVAADAAGIGRVHVAAWRDAYPGILPAAYLAGLSPNAHAGRWRSLLSQSADAGVYVAEAMGQVVGYGSCGRYRTKVGQVEGEFHALYVDPDLRERGYGRRLMAAMARALRAHGFESACVWCLRDNPARWFYQRLGGKLFAEQPIRFAGRQLVQVGYRWADAASLDRLAESAGPRTARDRI